MTYALFPLGSKPLGQAPGPQPSTPAFVEFINSFDGEGQYLVEITGYKGGELRSGGFATFGQIPLGSIPKGGGVDPGEITLRYADRHWVGEPAVAEAFTFQDGSDFTFQDGSTFQLNSTASVTNPNIYYEGRVSVPLLMERRMPLLPEEARRVQRQFGAIEILNGDGELDTFVQALAIDGRQTRVLYGPYMSAYASFGVIASALGTSWEAADLKVRLNLRDQSYSLDLPVQSNLYAGTGGAEGTSEIEGKPKPLAYGIDRNVMPTLVDPTNLIYQIHDGAVSSVDDVYDRGAALTDSLDDVSTYAALVSLPVTSGEFATALAVGLFKLGSSPSGLVTCDVQGDATSTYSTALDVIARRILEDRAGLSPSLINTSAIAGAGASATTIGLYVSSEETPTTAEVMNALAASIGGWWGAGRDGKIGMGRLVDPATRTPSIYLDDVDILRLEPEPTPVPRWRQKTGYQRNWTIQTQDIAGTVTDARRQFLAEDYRVVSDSDSSVKTRHKNATDPDFLATLLDTETEAQALATHLKVLFSPDRIIVRATVKRIGYLLDVNSYVRLTWPRLGLQNGRNMAVIGISDRADTDTIVLRLWG